MTLINRTLTQSMVDDSKLRSAVGSADLYNGNVVVLATLSTTAGEGEVWVATRPESGTLVGNWMVAEPEVVVTYSGSNAFKGIDPDPRNFVIKSGSVFRAFKPIVGDIIELDAAAVATGTGAGAAYAVVTAATYYITNAAAAVTGLSLRLIGTGYVSLGIGTLGSSQRVTMYRYVVEVE